MKNVYFIVLDSLEGSALFSNRNNSKFIDRLSGKSLCGNNMYSEAPYTEAALNCLLSSKHTLENNGHMMRLKDKKTFFEFFSESGYEVFLNHYYPSIVPSYVVPGATTNYYIEGYSFSHLVDYRLKYFSDLKKENKLENDEINLLTELLEDNFKGWLKYLELIKNNDTKLELIIKKIEQKSIDESISVLKKEISKFNNDKSKYLDELLENLDGSPLNDIKKYNPTKEVIDIKIKKEIINRYKKTFKKIKRKQFYYNFKNVKFPLKKVLDSLKEKDILKAKGILVSYKNLLIDKDIMDRISINYEKMNLWPSFRKIAEHSLSYYETEKSPHMHYIHIDETHYPENFFTHDTNDFEILDKEFNKINDFLDNMPKDYKGTITKDLSILYCDGIIEEIYNRLKKIDDFENTVLILTADHGFSFNFYPFRHEYVNTFYKENYRVPYLFYTKNIKPNFNDKIYSTLDIAPTILDIAGLNIPKDYKGTSILKNKGRNFSYVEYMGGGCPDIKRKKINLGVRTENYSVYCKVKITEEIKENIVEIYDLKKDPNEEKNLLKIKNQLKIHQEIEILEKKLNKIKNEYQNQNS